MNPAEIEALIAAKKAGVNLSEMSTATAVAQPASEVLPPDFGDFDSTMGGAEVPISALMDLKLEMSIELGRTTMSVQDILQLGRGSVVQLDRLAGEPIDIFVGDRRFAEGEVVVLGENFGVRVTRILSKQPAPGTL
jgi:flagellar motor switch protein FliN